MATATVIPKLWNEPDCSTLGGRLGAGFCESDMKVVPSDAYRT
jgi:hypothetical protein